MRHFGDFLVKGHEEEKLLWVRLAAEAGEAVTLFHFGKEPLNLSLPWPPGRWLKRLDSGERRWQGPGSDPPAVLEGGTSLSLRISPQSLWVYLRQDES